MNQIPQPPGGYNCAQVWPLLFEYFDDGLDPDRRDIIAAHLRVCFPCQSAADLIDIMRERVYEQGEIEAPAHLHDRIRSLITSDEIPEDLPGTFPEPESEEERIRRMSRFSTRRKPAPHAWTNEDVTDAEASQARREMGLPGPEEVEAPAPLPITKSDTAPADIQQELDTRIQRADAATVVRSRVQWLYTAGIAAILLLALLVVVSSQRSRGRQGDPAFAAQQPYIEALLLADFSSYNRMEAPTAMDIERRIAQNPAATWQPIVFPALDPALASYAAADVWAVGEKPVACAFLKMQGHSAALMASPWSAEEPIPGEELLEAFPVDDYEFMAMDRGNRHLVAWKHQWDRQMVLYTLVVEGDVTLSDMQDMALDTRLEIEQRAREQSGKVP